MNASEKRLAKLLIPFLLIALSLNSHAALILDDIDYRVDNEEFFVDLDGDQVNDIRFRAQGGSFGFGTVYALNNKVEFAYSYLDHIHRFTEGESIGESNEDVRWRDLYSGLLYEVIAYMEGDLLFYEANGDWVNNNASGFMGYRIFDELNESYNYGFFEITKGSIILGNHGFQTTANASAVAVSNVSNVSVPETTSAILLMLGLGGIVFRTLKCQKPLISLNAATV